jgi:hypothetical protein
VKLKYLTILLAAAAVFGSAIYVKSQMVPEVTLMMEPRGLTSVKCNGAEFLDSGEFHVNEVLLRKASGETYAGATSGAVSVNVAARQLTSTYPWGTVQVRYTAERNHLNLKIETKNTSSDTIQGIWYAPLVLRFPEKVNEYDGSIPLLEHNIDTPGILRVSYQSGVLVITTEDGAKPLQFGFPWAANRPINTTFPLTLNTDRVKSLPDSYPSINRPIPPGGSDQYNISLRFGRPGDSVRDLAPDVYSNYAKAFPSKLNWTDRRPIGAVFLASAATDWAKNPRGWLMDSHLDVTTPQGRDQLRDGILKLADQTISILRDMNAQGVITWDIEGQEYAHSVSYIGDPRLVGKLAPEMSGIADAYFKKFRDAGFRVGVCVRPQQVTFSSGKALSQQPSADPAEELTAKIKFAKEQWGATIIYIDSNVNANDPNPLDAQIMEKLAATFPDVLLIPEHSNLRYYAYTAPYRELRQGFATTDADVLAVYPKAFSLIYTADGLLDFHHKTLAAAVKRGDSLIYRSWYPDPQNEKVKSLYR